MMGNTALHRVPVGTFFQLPGAVFHFSHLVHAFLDRDFPDHWIGRRGPIHWLLHSPDLNPSDLFFSGGL